MDKDKKKSSGRRSKFSDAFKRKVAREYLKGGVTLEELAVKYNLNDITVVKRFVDWYQQVEASSEPLPASELEGEDQQDPKALKKKIKELQKLLEHEQLRSLGFETMIDIAEEELGIDIRKKSGTKQSKP